MKRLKQVGVINSRPQHHPKHLQDAVRAYNAGDMGRAERLFQLAVAHEPKQPEAYRILGSLQAARGAYGQASESLSAVVTQPQARAEDFLNLGFVLRKVGRTAEAITCFDRAIELRPDYEKAFVMRGSALQAMNRLEEALTNYQALLQVKPDAPHAHFNIGSVLYELGRLEEAQLYLIFALHKNPDHPFLPGLVAYLSALKCDWAVLDAVIPKIAEGLIVSKPTAKPFCLFPLTDDPLVLLNAARSWVENKVGVSQQLLPIRQSGKRDKIHVAYLSADFHDHATSHLMAHLFECHDRSKFEISGISFGPDSTGLMRSRLVAAFDRFEDVKQLTDVEVANLCRSIGVDIAVDLKGFLRDARPGIFAARCAPIQINYLGMPGTMGAPFIDYIIADRTLIKDTDLQFYSEKVIWMPHSYQVNDKKRYIPRGKMSRKEVGLPENAFVFCCFNNNYKILPTTFDIWMRALHRVPGSVIWLLEDNPSVAWNLKREAIARGIPAERLIFAKRTSPAAHLERQTLADLFIDTWPCNAHTTASDALWVGLPLVTRSGRSFASRVAASLLEAVHLPELITHTDDEYEGKIISLANDPATLHRYRQHLRAVRDSCPLFDCERFTHDLETGYQLLMDRFWTGEQPTNLDLSNRKHSRGTPAA